MCKVFSEKVHKLLLKVLRQFKTKGYLRPNFLDFYLLHPLFHLIQRPLRQQPPSLPAPRLSLKGRKEAKVDIHRLKRNGWGMGDVMDQGANSRIGRRKNSFHPSCLAKGIDACQKPHCCRFHIPFHTRDLTRKKEVRTIPQLERFLQ